MNKSLFISITLTLVLGQFSLFAGGSSEGTGTAPAGAISVEHKLGSIMLAPKPARVVTFAYDTLEILRDLGVPVLAVAKSNLPPALKEFSGEKYSNAGTLFEPDYETLYKLKPDVIFISDRQASVYAELSKIAPVVYTTIDPKDYSGSFKKNLTLIGRIFAKEGLGETLLDTVTKRSAAIREKALATKPRTLFLMVNQGAISVFGKGSRFGFIHDDFGFEAADSTIQASAHGQTIGFEYLAQQNPDLILVLDRAAAVEGGGSAASVLDNPLVKGTKAAKSGRIIYVDAAAWYLSSGGSASTLGILDDLERAVSR